MSLYHRKELSERDNEPTDAKALLAQLTEETRSGQLQWNTTILSNVIVAADQKARRSYTVDETGLRVTSLRPTSARKRRVPELNIKKEDPALQEDFVLLRKVALENAKPLWPSDLPAMSS